MICKKKVDFFWLVYGPTYDDLPFIYSSRQLPRLCRAIKKTPSLINDLCQHLLRTI